jgi:outer membrane protein
MNRRYLSSFILLCSFSIANAKQIDLMEAWQSALNHDKDYAYAQSGYGVVTPKQNQAKALWRPNVILNGSVGVGYQQSKVDGAQFSTPAFGKSNDVAFNTSVNGGLSDRITLMATQPIYSPKRRAEQAQLVKSADIHELQWSIAKQALILKVAQQYFDIAVSQKNLEVTEHQLHSVQQLATEMQDRFEIGTTPITDTHEAKARLAAIEAQKLSAELDLENKKNIFSDTTGIVKEKLTVLLPTTNQNGLNNTSVETLIERSESENLNIQLSKLQAKLASLETGKYNWKSSISVDAVGQVTRQEIDGSGQYGSASARETNALIGLQVSIPLSTGGYRQAKLEENVQLASQAQINVDRTRQQIAQHIKHTYLQINIGDSRVEALFLKH